MTTPISPNSEERASEGTWAKSGSDLKVSDAPSNAINLNVEGRQVVGPLQGFGQLWQKTYRVPLRDVDVSPAGVISELKKEFPRFQPPSNRFYPSVAGVAPGEVVLINASTPGGPVSTGVLVMYVDDESFTLMTPEGHPESGWVTFSAYTEDGCTVCQVQSIARANDPMYELAFRIIGSREQEKIWRYVLTSLAAHYGIKAEVEMKKTCVDPRLQWAHVRNIWYNAAIRTAIYRTAAPVRWVRRRGR